MNLAVSSRGGKVRRFWAPAGGGNAAVRIKNKAATLARFAIVLSAADFDLYTLSGDDVSTHSSDAVIGILMPRGREGGIFRILGSRSKPSRSSAEISNALVSTSCSHSAKGLV